MKWQPSFFPPLCLPKCGSLCSLFLKAPSRSALLCTSLYTRTSTKKRDGGGGEKEKEEFFPHPRPALIKTSKDAQSAGARSQALPKDNSLVEKPAAIAKPKLLAPSMEYRLQPASLGTTATVNGAQEGPPSPSRATRFVTGNQKEAAAKTKKMRPAGNHQARHQLLRTAAGKGRIASILDRIFASLPLQAGASRD